MGLIIQTSKEMFWCYRECPEHIKIDSFIMSFSEKNITLMSKSGKKNNT